MKKEVELDLTPNTPATGRDPPPDLVRIYVELSWIFIVWMLSVSTSCTYAIRSKEVFVFMLHTMTLIAIKRYAAQREPVLMSVSVQYEHLHTILCKSFLLVSLSNPVNTSWSIVFSKALSLWYVKFKGESFFSQGHYKVEVVINGLIVNSVWLPRDKYFFTSSSTEIDELQESQVSFSIPKLPVSTRLLLCFMTW